MGYSYDRTAAGMVMIGILQDGVDDVKRMAGPHGKLGELADEVDRQRKGLDRTDPRAKILDQMKHALDEMISTSSKSARVLDSSIRDLQKAQSADWDD